MYKGVEKYKGTEAYERAKTRLKQMARNKRKNDYSPIFAILELRPGNHAQKEAGQLLGEISAEMHEKGKPMLSAIITGIKTNRPGDGFYDLAIALGKLRKDASEAEREDFWKREINAVFAAKWDEE